MYSEKFSSFSLKTPKIPLISYFMRPSGLAAILCSSPLLLKPPNYGENSFQLHILLYDGGERVTSNVSAHEIAHAFIRAADDDKELFYNMLNFDKNPHMLLRTSSCVSSRFWHVPLRLRINFSFYSFVSQDRRIRFRAE